MQKKTRRRLPQGLTVMMPAATCPVVESVILPARARTSGPHCSAALACEALQHEETGGNQSFSCSLQSGNQFPLVQALSVRRILISRRQRTNQ